MVRKKRAPVVDLSSSDNSDTGGFEDIQCSQPLFTDCESLQSDSENEVVLEVSFL